MDDKQKARLKSLPKIDEVLAVLEKRGTLARAPREKVLEAIRQVVDEIRSAVLAGAWAEDRTLTSESAAEAVTARIKRLREYSLRRVINATGRAARIVGCQWSTTNPLGGPHCRATKAVLDDAWMAARRSTIVLGSSTTPASASIAASPGASTGEAARISMA